MSKYHSGEREVQKIAGVQYAADRLSGSVLKAMPEPARQFAAACNFAAITWLDDEQHLWITPLSGGAGFIRATDERTIEFDMANSSSPIVSSRQFEDDPIALVLMDFAGRRRMRVNGTARSVGENRPHQALLVSVAQAYANCPKYIQKREPDLVDLSENRDAENGAEFFAAAVLDADQQELINSADTFFIGTYASAGGADASHRGGAPGFVKADENKIAWIDYPGNNMFNTLGNIQVNRETALLFVDFESRDSLAISGSVETFTPSVDGVPAVSETVFTVRSARLLPRALAQSWTLLEYSPFNSSV